VEIIDYEEIDEFSVESPTSINAEEQPKRSKKLEKLLGNHLNRMKKGRIFFYNKIDKKNKKDLIKIRDDIRKIKIEE
jgi:hypothetical protein